MGDFFLKKECVFSIVLIYFSVFGLFRRNISNQTWHVISVEKISLWPQAFLKVRYESHIVYKYKKRSLATDFLSCSPLYPADFVLDGRKVQDLSYSLANLP